MRCNESSAVSRLGPPPGGIIDQGMPASFTQLLPGATGLTFEISGVVVAIE